MIFCTAQACSNDSKQGLLGMPARCSKRCACCAASCHWAPLPPWAACLSCMTAVLAFCSKLLTDAWLSCDRPALMTIHQEVCLLWSPTVMCPCSRIGKKHKHNVHAATRSSSCLQYVISLRAEYISICARLAQNPTNRDSISAKQQCTPACTSCAAAACS